MQSQATKLKDALLIQPQVFGDDRGFFYESYHQEKWKALGISQPFVQDNHSRSTKGILRGLHLQKAPHEQSKVVRCILGEIYDVIVDLRADSPTFKKWEGFKLSSENKQQLYVPKGFAHGFLVVSDVAEVVYKCDAFYCPEAELSLRYDDADLGVEWPEVGVPFTLSEKDKAGQSLKKITE